MPRTTTTGSKMCGPSPRLVVAPCKQPADAPFTIEEAVAQVIYVYDRYEAPESKPGPVPRHARGHCSTEEESPRRPLDFLRRSDARLPDLPEAWSTRSSATPRRARPGSRWRRSRRCFSTAGPRRSDVDHNTCLAIVNRLMQFGAPKQRADRRGPDSGTDAEDKDLLLRVVAGDGGRGGRTSPSRTRRRGSRRCSR